MTTNFSAAFIYFSECWNDLFALDLSPNTVLLTFNPRIALKELQDELMTNKVVNKENRNFFRRILGKYEKKDPGCQGKLKIQLSQILKEFELIDRRPLHIKTLVQNTLMYFYERKYIVDCVDELKNCLVMKFDDAAKEKIKIIVASLAIEFRELGYAEDDLSDFGAAVFNRHDFDDDYPWFFPHGAERNESTGETPSQFRERLRVIHDALSEPERLDGLSKLANREAKQFRYYFKVYGISARKVFETSFATFYNPHLTSMLDPETRGLAYMDEKFGRSESPECVNAVTTIKAVSAAGGVMEARANVHRAFGYLRLSFEGSRPLKWTRQSRHFAG